MIYKSIEIEFLPDETGRQCIVPDLKKNFPEEIFKRNEFKFYIIRQLKDGVPTELYLKDVSSLRTPEQNAISKYKFQSINVSFDGLNQDTHLVRLKPGDKLDLPDYSKNQKEYACFENLTNGNAEIVAVFRKLKNEELNDPELFKVNYTNKNEENKIIIPEITKDNKLFYREIQEDMNNLLSTLPDSDFSTQYLFCGNLNAIIEKKDYRYDVSVAEKKITDSLQECNIDIKIVSTNQINPDLPLYTTISKYKGEKVYKKLVNKVIDGYNFVNVLIKQFFMDKECTIPFSDKYNISAKFKNLTLYTKPEFLTFETFNGDIKIINTCGIKLHIKPDTPSNSFSKSFLENKFKQYYKIPDSFSSFEIRRKSTKEILQELTLIDILRDDYELEMHKYVSAYFKPLGESVTFDLFNHYYSYYGNGNIDDKYIFFAADITRHVDKETNFFSYYSLGFSVEQYEKDEILLVFRPSKSRVDSISDYPAFLKELAVLSSNYGTNDGSYGPLSISGGLDFYIVDQDSRIILEKFHSDCEIKRIFCGHFYADACYGERTTLYATKIDTTELEKRYEIVRNIFETAMTRAEVAEVIYNHVGNRVIIDDYYFINFPNYRPYYDYGRFGSRKFYVPDSIMDKSGEELSFWDYTKTSKYYLCIFVRKK